MHIFQKDMVLQMFRHRYNISLHYDVQILKMLDFRFIFEREVALRNDQKPTNNSIQKVPIPFNSVPFSSCPIPDSYHESPTILPSNDS